MDFNNDDVFYLGLYVDDIVLCGKENDKMRRIKQLLSSKFKLNDLGRIKQFIGIRFEQQESQLEMDLEQYIEKLLIKFDMQDCIPSELPAIDTMQLSLRDAPKTQEETIKMKDIPYRQLIGSLLFTAITIIPEISYAVSKCAEFMNNPGMKHWNEAKRILSYLKGIKHEKFIYLKSDEKDKFLLYCYSDADWAANLDTRKSRAGFMGKLGNCLISWYSVNEGTVALSSAESELIAGTLATRQIVFLRDILQFIGFKQHLPTILFEDNTACIKISQNPILHKRTKHIQTQWFFVRERQRDNEEILKYVRSENNIADIFTKALPRKSFYKLLQLLYGFQYEQI